MKKRYDYIDIAKALGMIFVMWGHLMLGGITNRFVYAFHIPLFFFLSGMMFNKEYMFGAFVVRRVRTLLLPYVIFSVLTWGYWVARNCLLNLPMDSLFMPLFQTFLAQGSGGFLIHNVALWFVTCLFAVEILYYWISRLPALICMAVCVGCGFIGYWMIQPKDWFDFTLLPWNIECSMTAIVFYATGNLLIGRFSHEQIIESVINNKCISLVISFVCFVAVFFLSPNNGHITIAQGQLGENVFLFYLLAFCGITFALIFSILLSRTYHPLVVWFGRNSFFAMAIHIPVMVDMIWVWSKIKNLDINDLRYDMKSTIPIFILMLMVTLFWIWLLKHVKKTWSAWKILKN